MGKFHSRIDRANLTKHYRTAPGTPREVCVKCGPRDAHTLMELRPEGIRIGLTDLLHDGGCLDASNRHFRINPYATAGLHMHSTAPQFDGFPSTKNRLRVRRCERDENVTTIGHLVDLRL